MSLYWFDTEFHERNDGICELISIGIVADDGRELYAEADFDEPRVHRESPWLVQNVLPHLGNPRDRLPREQLRDLVEDFLHPKMAKPPFRFLPEMWGYFVSTDWTLLYRLWGRMVDLPQWMPHHPFCVQQWLRQTYKLYGVMPPKPKQPEQRHNALADAIWTRDCWRTLVGWHVARGYKCPI